MCCICLICTLVHASLSLRGLQKIYAESYLETQLFRDFRICMMSQRFKKVTPTYVVLIASPNINLITHLFFFDLIVQEWWWKAIARNGICAALQAPLRT